MTNSGCRPAKLLVPMLLVMVATLLSACGFQLTGQADLPGVLDCMQISGLDDNDELRVELARHLAANGIKVVDDADNASALLHVFRKQRGRRVLSVGSDGKVREYELYTRVTFDVKKPNQEAALLGDQTINLTRDYVFNENEVLGSNSEEDLLYEEMQGDIIRQIIYRLQTIKA